MSSSDPRGARSADEAIRTHALTTSYGSARGIVDLDLEVRCGEVYGFLGPNGAGKTTTIRTLLDLLRPSSGTASVLGLDSHRDSLTVRRRIGYLAGDLALYERLTGREHLDWLGGLRGAGSSPDLEELAERFEAELDRPIRHLSKGNRQKIGLIQAFMHRPELAILDEPTSGLDPLMQEEFLDLVREVVAEGRTVFLSSHSLDEVQHVADRVGIIRDGTLAAVESVDALRERAIRRVHIVFSGPAPLDEFVGLPGVHEASAEGSRLRLAVAGGLDAVVKAAARHVVVDLLSEPADLDEIFLTFYRGDVS